MVPIHLSVHELFFLELLLMFFKDHKMMKIIIINYIWKGYK